jgi:hypothetical protein
MKISDKFYIATDSEELKWALNILQHNGDVDWQSIRVGRTTRGCTPIWWEMRRN